MKIPPFIIDALPDYRALRSGYEFFDANGEFSPGLVQNIEKIIQDLANLEKEDDQM